MLQRRVMIAATFFQVVGVIKRMFSLKWPAGYLVTNSLSFPQRKLTMVARVVSPKAN